MERIEKSGVASDGDETELRNIKLNLTPEDGFKIGYLTKEGEMLEARRQVRELWEEFYNVQQEVTAAA